MWSTASRARSTAESFAPRSAAWVAASCSVVADVVVARRRRQGEVAGPLLHVAGELGERRVHGAALRGRRRLVAGLRHEGWADTTRPLRISTRRAVSASPSASRSTIASAISSVGLGRGGHREQQPASLDRHRVEPVGDEVAQRLGDGQRPARATASSPVRSSARPSSIAKSGLPARRLLEAHERRPAEHVVEVLAQQVVQRTEAERPDVDAQVAVDAVEPERAGRRPSSARSWPRPRPVGFSRRIA